MKKIRLILISIMLILSVLMLTGCGESMSYYNVKKMVAEDKESVQYVLLYGKHTNKIKEVWINLDSFSEDSYSLCMNAGSTESTTSIDKDVDIEKAFIEQTDGWYRVVNSVSYGYTYFKFNFIESVHVNEIVFVDTENKLVEMEVEKCGSHPSGSTTNEKSTTGDELKESGEKHTALCVIDEQNAFDYEKINASYQTKLTEYENQKKASESSSDSSN